MAKSKQQPLKALQLIFGALFLATAVGKLLDNRGFAEVLANYRLFPHPILMPLALAVSLGELALGALLWRSLIRRGHNVKRLAWITAAINGGYLGLAALTLARGIPLSNCGCFGVFLPRALTPMTLVEDGALLVLSLIFVRLAK